MTINIKTVSSIFAAAVLLCSPIALRADVVPSNPVQFFGIAGAYQDVFFGNYSGKNGDIEGHAAIQGDLYAYKYGFGDGQQNLHQSGPVLVVGGNVTGSQSSVYDGNAYIKGTMQKDALSAQGTYFENGNPIYNTLDPSYRGTPGTISTGVSSLPFDFTVAKDQLRAATADLRALESTVTGGYNYKSWFDPNKGFESGFANGYTIDLTGLSGLQVVDLDASVFNNLVQFSAGYLNILGGADTTLIINITDTTGLGLLNLSKEIYINGHHVEEQLAGSLDYDFNGSNILFNVDGSIKNINVKNAQINASFLALDSNFNVELGEISGQVFGASATTTNGGEFHAYYTFDDQHLTNNAATPEPGTLLIVGIGLAGAALARRRMKKA